MAVQGRGGGGGEEAGQRGLLLTYLPNDASHLLGWKQKGQLVNA